MYNQVRLAGLGERNSIRVNNDIVVQAKEVERGHREREAGLGARRG